MTRRLFKEQFQKALYIIPYGMDGNVHFGEKNNPSNNFYNKISKYFHSLFLVSRSPKIKKKAELVL